MGCYVNPSNESKEEFLMREGEVLPGAPASIDIKSGKIPVCLVNNSIFSAAAVAYSEGELHSFADPNDLREKVWFLVEKTKLLDVSDIVDYLDVS